MNDSIQLVWNKYNQIVPLKSFQISMTEGQIQFLIEILEQYDCLDQMGFHIGKEKSICSVLENQKNELSNMNTLLQQFKEKTIRNW